MPARSARAATKSAASTVPSSRTTCDGLCVHSAHSSKSRASARSIRRTGEHRDLDAAGHRRLVETGEFGIAGGHRGCSPVEVGPTGPSVRSLEVHTVLPCSEHGDHRDARLLTPATTPPALGPSPPSGARCRTPQTAGTPGATRRHRRSSAVPARTQHRVAPPEQRRPAACGARV